MLNTDDFIKRLEILLDYYSLSASGFADKIGVQRSSLSHLLSGRNKPSLDFILKINEFFKEIDLYWLLNGQGNFLKSENLASKNSSSFEIKKESNDAIINANLFSESQPFEKSINEDISEKRENIALSSSIDKKNQIDRIVIFYIDGTFSEHVPK